jgi:hypothetical protein
MMESGFTFNPVSAVLFAAVGVWAYFYSRTRPWLLTRRLRRTPASLAICCTILPFPFLFIFVMDIATLRGDFAPGNRVDEEVKPSER